jgi:2,4-dienoyl-CoA reductase-like NADH-dependent reductase (Old Yellow Enzyme family)
MVYKKMLHECYAIPNMNNVAILFWWQSDTTKILQTSLEKGIKKMTSSSDILSEPLVLPCGVRLPGRIVKAAMTEGLADQFGRATEKHVKLYEIWSRNHNAGHVLLTGNIAVDRRYPERPGNVCIGGAQSPEALEALRKYAKAAQLDGTLCFAQLSHGGRQTNAMVNLKSVAPSPIKVDMLGIPMSEPRALTSEEIDNVVERFTYAAGVCKDVGFAGIQIHSAHGYLLSSFLNPKANIRSDEYGGSLENRSRLLFRVVRSVRSKVGPAYPISVKMNSSDFQKGGFSPDEALVIARQLEQEGVDLLEVSGGNYENPSMMFGPEGFTEITTISNMGKYSSTELREGYFLLFAEKMREAVTRMPLMVTGGFRSRSAMEQALTSNACDVIGVGRPMCGTTDAVGKLLRREISELPKFEKSLDLPWYVSWLKFVVVGHLVQAGGFQAWTYMNLIRMSLGQKPTTEKDANLLADIIRLQQHDSSQAVSLKGLDDISGLSLNSKGPSITTILARIVAVIVALFALRRALKQ